MKTSKSRRRKTSKSRRLSSRGDKRTRPQNEKLSHEKKTALSHESHERVDWLARNGKAIGTIDKLFAHKHGLYHEVAHVIILDTKNRIISQERGKWMLLAPGKFDTSAGGHITSGETRDKAMAREAEEEMGVRGTLHYLGHFDIRDITKTYRNHERVHLYWMRTRKDVRYQRSEIQGVKRIPVEAMDAFAASPRATIVLKSAWKKFGKSIAHAAKMKNLSGR